MNGPTNKKINSIIYHGVLLKVLLAPGGLMLGFFCSCAAAGTAALTGSLPIPWPPSAFKLQSTRQSNKLIHF